MAAGDGLGLFIPQNRTPCGGPGYTLPPEVGPHTPSTVITGTWNFTDNGTVSVTKPAGVQAGDVMIAFMSTLNGNNVTPPSTMAAGLPAGWSICREDYNTGVGAINGPMYSGVAVHIAGSSEPSSYTFTEPAGHQFYLTVTIVVARNSLGIESVAATLIDNSATGHITAPSAPTADHIELVWVFGCWGTGSGSVITSDNGLPLAVPAPGPQAHAVFYQFSTGANSSAQGLTCSSGNNAFTAYQVAMLPGP